MASPAATDGARRTRRRARLTAWTLAVVGLASLAGAVVTVPARSVRPFAGATVAVAGTSLCVTWHVARRLRKRGDGEQG